MGYNSFGRYSEIYNYRFIYNYSEFGVLLLEYCIYNLYFKV